jgi:S-adenosylmethionine hydrolase
MKHATCIALLTDFGSRDPYVGVMKGVIHTINPAARVIDITHDVSPFNIEEGAFLLWSAYRYFPEGTIFACVVDPGVGSERDILYVEAGKYRFIVPDNGLMKFIQSDHPALRVIRLRNRVYFLPRVSSTFHGRDIVAPVAARLAKGLSPTRLGPTISRRIEREDFISVVPGRRRELRGRILHIDTFGNCITNFIVSGVPTKMDIRAGRRRVTSFFEYYVQSPAGKPFGVTGSTGLLEICMKNENAAKVLGLRMSDEIRVRSW